MRKILWVTVRRKDGFEYYNPLKLSELHLVNSLLNLEDVESIKIEKLVVGKERFEELFGS